MPIRQRRTRVDVDTVQDYRYLGVQLDNKLDWAKNPKAVEWCGSRPRATVHSE